MSDTGHSALTSSLTDMMTSLMVIFVLLLVNYLGNRQSEIAQARSKTDEMQSQFSIKLREALINDVKVQKIDDYNLVVIVPEDKLQFESGMNQLNDAASIFLNQFVPVLLETYKQFESDVSLINVEGHTDKKLKENAANKYYNWDLSQERASAVMKFMFNYRKEASDSSAVDIDNFKQIALFGGRGPIECPYSEQDDEALRKTCRTVKFKIRLKSSEESKAIRDNLHGRLEGEK
ncbi:MAG: OmpA family protein [Deltaproteobacteria bacterium]|nr:OmpA family protein [Deltaproteobacteria bacterium]